MIRKETVDLCNYCKWDNDTIEGREHCRKCYCLETEGKFPNEFELKETVRQLIKMLDGGEHGEQKNSGVNQNSMQKSC